jgi:hypothetical protein
MLEMNFQKANHIIYLRRLFPYMDYYNRYLVHSGQEVSCFDLRVIVYTDTSNLAYQLISQNSRQLKSNKAYKTVTAHLVRYRVVFSILCSGMSLTDNVKRRSLADKLAHVDQVEMFNMYRQLALMLEWLGNYPANFMILHELKEIVKSTYYGIISNDVIGEMAPDMKPQIEKVVTGSCILTDDFLRHELISLNDYVRKNNKIVSTIVDDETVLYEIRKYLKQQFSWLEDSRSHMML